MTRGRPAAVRNFEQALADWLASFTSPAGLGAEMADACAEGAPWAAAIAAAAARRAGWPDAEAMAWGLCVGGCAGALEAARRALAAESPSAAPDRTEGRARSLATTGPALPLLAADGLIAAAHETLGSLRAARARAALDALARTFGDGGPWRGLSAEWPAPAWPVVVPCALGLAAGSEPGGPWSDWAEAWDAAYGGPERAPVDQDALWNHPSGDREMRALLRAAASAAAGTLTDVRS